MNFRLLRNFSCGPSRYSMAHCYNGGNVKMFSQFCPLACGPCKICAPPPQLGGGGAAGQRARQCCHILPCESGIKVSVDWTPVASTDFGEKSLTKKSLSLKRETGYGLLWGVTGVGMGPLCTTLYWGLARVCGRYR